MIYFSKCLLVAYELFLIFLLVCIENQNWQLNPEALKPSTLLYQMRQNHLI
jgi:hypothetical protein